MPGSSKGAHLAAVAVRWTSDVSRIAERMVAPLLDLFIRLWLAGIFWASGMVNLHVWTTPSKQGRFGMCAAVGCGHVSGLCCAAL